MIRRKDLYTALADSAFRFPDKIALVEAGTGKKVSYHELLMQVDRAADMFLNTVSAKATAWPWHTATLLIR